MLSGKGATPVLARGPVAVLGGHELMIFLLQAGILLAGVLMGPSLLAHVLRRLSSALLPPRTEQFHLLDAVGSASPASCCRWPWG